MKKYLTFFVLLLLYTAVYGQEKVHKVGFQWERGPVIPHTINFRPETSRWIQSLTLFLETERSFEKPQGLFRWNINWMHFGNEEILGQSISLYLSALLLLSTHNSYMLSLHLGSGLGYVTKKYHPIHNPENNAIGSHINNISQLGIVASTRRDKHWQLEGQIHFTHFSNGSFQNPNLGINTLSAGISVKRQLSRIANIKPLPEFELKSNYISLRQGVAIQNNVPGGPRHLVLSHSASYLLRTGKKNALGAGLHVGYNDGEYRWMLRRTPEKRNAHRIRAFDLALQAMNEWYIGKVSLVTMAGVYLYDPFYKIAPVFIKLGFHYYPFSEANNWQNLFFFGSIKSHFFIADYMEFGIGFRL